jgi:hypothetical protein
MLHDLDLYKEYYEGSNSGTAKWALIFSDGAAEIKALEGVLKMTQAEAVDDFIEDSCWKDDLTVRVVVGKKGSADDRLHRLRTAYLIQNARVPGYTQYNLLTPLEHGLFDLVRDMEKNCTNADLKHRAQLVMKMATRIADRAKQRWRKELEGLIEKEGIDMAVVTDATGAESLDDFIDNFVAKDRPEIAAGLRKDLAAQKKKKAKGKPTKK